MGAGHVMVSPERGTSRVLFRRADAKPPPGDWDAGWPSLAVPKFVKLNASGWFVCRGDSAFRRTGRSPSPRYANEA